MNRLSGAGHLNFAGEQIAVTYEMVIGGTEYKKVVTGTIKANTATFVQLLEPNAPKQLRLHLTDGRSCLVNLTRTYPLASKADFIVSGAIA